MIDRRKNKSADQHIPPESNTVRRWPRPDAGGETYDLALLDGCFAKWKASSALRSVYGHLYAQMAGFAQPGPALEIGSGCGTAREFIPGIVTTDVRKTPFVEQAASAYAIESVPGGPWETIYALDVLHHLREPLRFFASSSQALAPGGRLIICDPSASHWARLVYRLVHHEPIAPERVHPPWTFPADNDSGDFANMGMAWAMFVRSRRPTETLLAGYNLKIASVTFRDVIAYLSTGGFSRSTLTPRWLVKGMLAMEQRLPQWILRVLGMRAIVVLERCSAASDK